MKSSKPIEIIGGPFDAQSTIFDEPVLCWNSHDNPMDFHFYTAGFRRDERVYFYKTADQYARILMQEST